LHARALRADFCDELLHQIRIRLDVIAATIGPLFLTLIRVGGKDPFGDLPSGELFLGAFLQVADDGLCEIY